MPLVPVDAAPPPAEAALVAASDGFEAVPGVPFPLAHRTLSSGLALYVQPRADATSTVAYLVFNAGSRYETPSDNGVSHLLEHMLFVGTARWDEDELRAVIDRAGGRFNGQTWQQQVGYWAQMPADRTDELLDWLAQVAFHPTLPEAKLAKEREVVFEERGGRDGFSGRLRKAIGVGRPYRTEIRRALFPGSSRGLPVIGDDASLEAVDADALRAFYARHYHAGNAALVVVGPVAPAAIGATADRLFGTLPGGEPLRVPEDAAPAALGGRTTVRAASIADRCTVTLAARGPGLQDADRWAIAVLLQYLDIGLTETLRGERGLTYGIGTWSHPHADAGEIGVESDTDCANVDLLAEAFATATDAVRDGEVDEDRLDRARRRVAGSWAIEVEDSRARAEWLVHELGVDEPFRASGRHLAVPAVDRDALVAAARRWLDPAERGTWVHRPVLTVAEAWSLGIAVAAVALAGGVALRRRLRASTAAG